MRPSQARHTSWNIPYWGRLLDLISILFLPWFIEVAHKEPLLHYKTEMEVICYAQMNELQIYGPEIMWGN